MKKLRFALALAALGLAGTPSSGRAADEASCPIAHVYGQPWGTCGYTGHGSCSQNNCRYECENGWVGVIQGCGAT